MVDSDSTKSYLKRLVMATCIGAAMSAPALAQSEDSNVAAYNDVLQRIADLQLTTDRQSVYLASQEAKIANLQAQLAGVSETTDAVPAMLDKMVVAIEDFIQSDIPFKEGERYSRLDSFKETVADPAATVADKMRKALTIYEIETNYGQSLEAYDADGPADAGKRREACAADLASAGCALTEDMTKRVAAEGLTYQDVSGEIFDGTYLRYGRLSLAYVSADGSDVLRYNSETKTWDPLPTTKGLEVRRAIRIARGESAPGVVSAPVIVAN